MNSCNEYQYLWEKISRVMLSKEKQRQYFKQEFTSIANDAEMTKTEADKHTNPKFIKLANESLTYAGQNDTNHFIAWGSFSNVFPLNCQCPQLAALTGVNRPSSYLPQNNIFTVRLYRREKLDDLFEHATISMSNYVDDTKNLTKAERRNLKVTIKQVNLYVETLNILASTVKEIPRHITYFHDSPKIYISTIPTNVSYGSWNPYLPPFTKMAFLTLMYGASLFDFATQRKPRLCRFTLPPSLIELKLTLKGDGVIMFERFENLAADARYRSHQLGMMNNWLRENGLYENDVRDQFPRGTTAWPYECIFPINVLENPLNASSDGSIPLNVEYRFAAQGLTSPKWYAVLVCVQEYSVKYDSETKEWSTEVMP